jgi:DNA-binding winged helix-turn-helix (wHTH) protein
MPTSDLQTWGGQAVAFGPFRLYPEQGVLLRADKPLLLGSRAREILLVLVERAGEIVKKSELIARVWPDSIVEEGTLRVHIATLRKALRDGQGGMRYVENVTGHGYRFVAPLQWIDAAQPRPVPQPAAEHDSVPIPLTRMIGRAPVVATLASRVPQRRFVTIVGPGGIGKTTVAMATADHLRASYPHGVYFIDLASIADPLLISATIASALGLATISQDPLLSVIEFLTGKQMLITLDNCEHVIEAAAVVAEKLLRGASGVNVIASSGCCAQRRRRARVLGHPAVYRARHGEPAYVRTERCRCPDGGGHLSQTGWSAIGDRTGGCTRGALRNPGAGSVPR